MVVVVNKQPGCWVPAFLLFVSFLCGVFASSFFFLFLGGGGGGGGGGQPNRHLSFLFFFLLFLPLGGGGGGGEQTAWVLGTCLFSFFYVFV